MKSVAVSIFAAILLMCGSPSFSAEPSELPCANCRLSPAIRTFLYVYSFSPTNLDLLSDKTVNFFRETAELAARYSPQTIQMEPRKTHVKGGDRDVPVFVFVPEVKDKKSEAKLPVILYIHGGGWTLGSTAFYESVIRKLAAATPAVVVSPDYALAPEHPFPQAVDDCYAALKWTAQHAQDYGADPSKLIVAGDSAGGNLAAVMALKSKEENGPKIAFQALFYPSVDISSTASDSAKCFSKGYFLTADAMVTFRSFYLPDPKDWDNPYASPLKAKDVTGLPPALITTAGCDPLLSDGEAYAKKLRDAGVAVTYHLEPNIFHGYLGFLNKDLIISPRAEKTLDYAASVIRDNVK